DQDQAGGSLLLQQILSSLVPVLGQVLSYVILVIVYRPSRGADAGLLRQHARKSARRRSPPRQTAVWLDAYHAADAPPLSADALAAVPSDRLGDLVFTAHPAARIVRSAYPAVTIFAMNRVEGAVTPLQSNAAEDALITRPDMEVAVRLLPPGGAAFLKTM